MDEQQISELQAENSRLQEELWAAQKAQLLATVEAKPLQRRLYARLLDWEALRAAEHREEALSQQLEALNAEFPELFEERREAADLPRFASIGRSRRRSVSEVARNIMGLRGDRAV